MALDEALFEADAVLDDPLFAFDELVLFDADGLADDLPVELVPFFADDFELGFLEACAFPPWLE